MVRTCTWPTCHNSLQPLVGRNVELATIERLMLDAGARLITLTGPGGVGKSRLALAAAEGLTEAFAHRVAFVELSKLGGWTVWRRTRERAMRGPAPSLPSTLRTTCADHASAAVASLELERDNLNAALRWLLRNGEVERAARVVAAVGYHRRAETRRGPDGQRARK